MNKVVHCKREKYDVLIDRTTKWGNPYSIPFDGTRAEVIEKYRKYLYSNSELWNSLLELDGKILGCWCHPQACHGDILIEALEEKKRQLKMIEDRWANMIGITGS